MAKQNYSWGDYERGRSSAQRQDSFGSNTSRVRFDETSPFTETDRLISSERNRSSTSPSHDLGRRRSSISMRINSIAQAGGANSIENFARSWQRAVGFHEITPARASFQYADDIPDFGYERQPDEERGPVHHRSLLRQHMEQEATPPDTAVIDDEPYQPRETREIHAHTSTERSYSSSPYIDRRSDSSPLAEAFSSSFGGTYGSLSTRVNHTSREHAAQLFREQQATGNQEPDKEREPLLLKRVEQEDGKVTIEVIGQSTIYQTVLNSTNVLIGVGLLSLPLGIRYAGWVIGITFLTLSAFTTAYTANLLGKCLQTDRNLITFADLAYVSFGPKAQVVIGLMFTLELAAAGVALFILFADSLNLLVAGWGLVEFKILCGVLMIPLNFVPLRLLGYTSSLGIICCLSIVALVIVDGLVKPDSPGSLREPAATYLFPQSWSTIPLSFGLLMSPWGGHAVFPNIMRDMRHPEKYSKSLVATFSFTYLLDASVAIVGLLMFGDDTKDEITSNIFTTEGYPRVISIILVTCIAIIPLTKLPLNNRPIFSTIEHLCGLGPREVPDATGLMGLSSYARGFMKLAIRIGTTLIIMTISIFCPSFDRVMALMGSAFCFTICIILPCGFYLRIFGSSVAWSEKILAWSLIIICSILASVGTVWAFLPREITGAR